MRTNWIPLLALTVAAHLAMLGCDKKSDAPPAPPRAAAPSPQSSESGHAPVGVRAGSHEDWCGEHQVPESMCTRCNASLIPAFKATGDWCAEHGLPESQCRICNPGLTIVRPPRAEGTSP